MSSETVIFILLAILVVVSIEWRRAAREVKEEKEARDKTIQANSRLKDSLQSARARHDQLEAEIIRLQRIPLTEKPGRKDNAVIKAKSPAQVRQLTEEAFGKQPEIGEVN
jgi:uncharacterized protein YlxW (UPF0749 family)